MPSEQRELFERLMRGLQEVIPSREVVTMILAGDKKLHVYLGFDATSPNLHLGHAVPLRILRMFQDLGHRTTMLLGDFTATVGDPSGRDSQRKVLTREQVEANVLSMRDQLGKVLDLSKTEIRFNSEWYDDPARVGSLRNFLSVAHHFTAAQLWERDMFQVRQAKGQPVSLTEFLYPILQAYDAVELGVDLELGGNDQLFNMLAGRTLAKQMTGTEKSVLTVPLLLGTDGRKMSKSFGNVISLTAEPNDMYGKLMAVGDDQTTTYFQLVFGRFVESTAEIDVMKPRDAKALLAREVVAFFHGSEAATEAESAWSAQFQDGAAPADVPEVVLNEQPRDLAQLLVNAGIRPSRSQAIQLVEQGGVSIDGQRQVDPLGAVNLWPNRSIRIKVSRYYWDIRRK